MRRGEAGRAHDDTLGVGVGDEAEVLPSASSDQSAGAAEPLEVVEGEVEVSLDTVASG